VQLELTHPTQKILRYFHGRQLIFSKIHGLGKLLSALILIRLSVPVRLGTRCVRIQGVRWSRDGIQFLFPLRVGEEAGFDLKTDAISRRAG
jgi:hypothetical protein